MSKKLIAKALGPLILVLFGCGSAVLMGAQIGMAGISAAFGLAIVAARRTRVLPPTDRVKTAMARGIWLNIR